MNEEDIRQLEGLAASMGLYDDKNPCERAIILGKAIDTLKQISNENIIYRSDALDLFGYAPTFTGEEAQRLLNNLPPVILSHKQKEVISC